MISQDLYQLCLSVPSFPYAAYVRPFSLTPLAIVEVNVSVKLPALCRPWVSLIRLKMGVIPDLTMTPHKLNRCRNPWEMSAPMRRSKSEQR